MAESIAAGDDERRKERKKEEEEWGEGENLPGVLMMRWLLHEKEGRRRDGAVLHAVGRGACAGDVWTWCESVGCD